MFAPDEGAEPAAHRGFEPRGPLANAIEAIGLLRLGLSLDGVFAGKARLDHTLHQTVCPFAHEHRRRRGQRLQARGEIHRVAENGDAGVGAVLHPADHRRAGIQPDPQLRPHAVLDLEIAAGVIEPLQNRQRRATGSQRRIFERNRRTEHRHDALAGKALHDAALFAHGFVHQLRQAPHQIAQTRIDPDLTLARRFGAD